MSRPGHSWSSRARAAHSLLDGDLGGEFKAGAGGPDLDPARAAALAEALGAMGARSVQGPWGFPGSLRRCLAALPGDPIRPALFLAWCAYSLREAWEEGLGDPALGSKRQIAFCISTPEECQELDARRAALGDRFDAGAASRSAMELLAAGRSAWAGAPPSGAARGLAWLAQCCLPFAAEPEEFLRALTPVKDAPMPGASDGLGMQIWPPGAADDPAECPWWGVGWAWDQLDPGLQREGHPWGLWLALAAPERLESWAGPLGADLERDRALAAWLGELDDEDWPRAAKIACQGAAAALGVEIERSAISESSALGKAAARRPL